MEGMNFSFFVMRGIDLWLLVGEFQPTCSPRYDVSINHEANGNAMSKTAPLNSTMVYYRVPAAPPVNGRFSSCSVYVIARLVPKSLPRENFCNLLILLSFWRKNIFGEFWYEICTGNKCRAFWYKMEKLQQFQTFTARRFCRGFGKNCRMTEQYSKTD